MKILFCASEAAPFIKTGGLADVAGSLPLAVKNMGHDIRVVIPLFSQVDPDLRERMEFIGYYYVDLAFRHEYVGVYTIDFRGVTYYFLDSQRYFDRPQIYGEGDDGERFLFFSKAVVQLPKVINFKPDVIHSNDWHTAMVNVYVKDFARGDQYYKDIKCLYTIHNLKYQGVFPASILATAGLSPFYFNEDGLKYYDAVNFMKGGIIYCDAFTTVSGTYAMEIKNPFYGEGLDGVIRAYDYKLRGIINGIDYEVWNPETDQFLAQNYSIETFPDKIENKREIQRRYGLPEKDDVPMIALVSRLVDMKGIDLVRYIMDELLATEDIQFVMLGTGEETYEEMFRYFEWKYPEKMAARIYYNNEESHLIYGGTDLFLMPSIAEPCGISQLISMRYGAIPIVRETGGLKDTVMPYNEYENTGTGFTFTNINAHDLLYTIRRALSFFHKEKDRNIIIENGMYEKNDWNESGKEYIRLYEELGK